MVRKLWKHEFAALARTLLPIQGIVLGVAVLCRLIQLFETDHFVYDIVFGSSVFFLVVSLVACLVSVTIFGVVRFYRNLFTTEGYLSFTLPVTPAQHIWVKFSTTFVFSLIAAVVTLIAASIAMAGDVLYEVLLAAEYLLNHLIELDGGVHFLFYLLEFLLWILIGSAGSMLFYYTCISIGQLARRNRVLLAIGVYFGFYAASQVLSTVVTIVFMVFGESIGEAIGNFIATYKFAAFHMLFAGGLAITVLMGVVWFWISNTILRKRLNLE